MDINLHGITGTVHFMWDMLPAEYDTIFDPVLTETTVYSGAVFFGKHKVEFIRSASGGYCNWFQYGAEDHPDQAYAYLEDGTPFEERCDLSDFIFRKRLPTFSRFAADIERQIIALLDRHPEYIPDAICPTDPDKWYPCDHPYHIDEITREN